MTNEQQIDIPPHTFPNCQWQHCPEHNPENDPAYTPTMQWPSISVPAVHENQSGGDIVSICAWCPELKILSLQRRERDVVVIMLSGEKQIQVWRNNVKLFVSHGICDPCQAKHFPKQPTSVAQEAHR